MIAINEIRTPVNQNFGTCYQNTAQYNSGEVVKFSFPTNVVYSQKSAKHTDSLNRVFK